jgi:DNA-binding NarL/FixJ family response regulator
MLVRSGNEAAHVAHPGSPENLLDAGDCLAAVAGRQGCPPATARLHTLSGRELQVAQLVSNGHTNREIARLLALSEKTIETYMARIFAKLCVSSRVEVAIAVAKAQTMS